MSARLGPASRLLVAGPSVALLAWVSAAPGQVVPPGAVDELPETPYATLGMKLEKTIFKVDVLALTLRVEPTTARRIAASVGRAGGRPRAAAGEVAEAVLAAPRAAADLVFLRDVRLDQFVDGVSEDVARAVDAGWVEPATARMLADSLPVWFAFLGERRIRDGDRLSYRIAGDTLRTVFWGVEEGAVLLDQTDVGRQNVLALLGAYVAPGSSFRRGLVASLRGGWTPPAP